MNEKKQKQRGLKQGFELIYKYRFVLSFLLLIMLVSFKISGSSMGCWKLFWEMAKVVFVWENRVYGEVMSGEH